MILRTCGMAAGLYAVAVAAMVSSPVAHADDFGLGDVLSDFVVSASTAELANHAVDQALAASASGAETVSAAELFQQYIYDPLHAGVESWINSSFGEQVDHLLNTASGQFLIGNGADGSSALDPNGGDGGLWFGDGGHGWDSDQAGFAGGSGGDAVGFLGNGGDGGIRAVPAPPAATAGTVARCSASAATAATRARRHGRRPARARRGRRQCRDVRRARHGRRLRHAARRAARDRGPRQRAAPLGTSGGWLTNSDGQVVCCTG